MLLLTSRGREKVAVWYGFPSKEKKISSNNIEKAVSNGWLSIEIANHFNKVFSLAPDGVASFPLDAKFVIEQA